MKDYVIGIDLGTTNSCVGVWKNGKAEIIADSQGNRIIPSYVSFTKDQRLIGAAAKKQITKNIKNTIYDTKRLIGRNYSDEHVQEDMKLYPFKIIKDPKEDRPLIEVIYKGEKKAFLPQEISAMILSQLKNQSEEYLGTTIKNAVITVPAYFNEGQKTATRDAGRIAGLNVLRIINEPTAAAIAYGLQNQFNTSKNIFVFDLGGGTFDVSILKLEHNTFEVLATNGNTHLGGEDFDNQLVKYCIEEFKQEKGIDISNNDKAKRRLKVYCEDLKKALSVNLESNIDIDGLAEGEDFEMARKNCKSSTVGLLENAICISFNTENETKNCYNSFITTFAKWCCKTSVTDIHVHQKFLPWMSDYSEPWTNKRFCEYYGVNGYIDDNTAEPNSEWETILNEMKDCNV